MSEWDGARLMLEVVRHGGLSRAARQLGVSHTTVSRQISALEKRLGVRLFDRRPEGVVPTPAGKEFAAAAGRMEAEYAGARLALSGLDQNLEGKLTVTAPSLLISHFLAPVLVAFSTKYPEIELLLNASHLPLDLSRGEADVALRATNTPPENLFGRKLLIQRRMVYASRALVLSMEQVGKRLQKGQDLPWIGFEDWTDETLQNLGGGRIVVRFDNMSVALDAAVAGMGVVLMPCFLGDANDGLVRVDGFDVQPYLDFWILTHPDLKDVARVRTFMRFVSEALLAKAELFSGDLPAD